MIMTIAIVCLSKRRSGVKLTVRYFVDRRNEGPMAPVQNPKPLAMGM